jgi:hypothetical protein
VANSLIKEEKISRSCFALCSLHRFILRSARTGELIITPAASNTVMTPIKTFEFMIFTAWCASSDCS